MAEIRLACPTCGTESAVDDAVPLPANAPFCSERCRLGELSRWYDGDYSVSRAIDETDVD